MCCVDANRLISVLDKGHGTYGSSVRGMRYLFWGYKIWVWTHFDKEVSWHTALFVAYVHRGGGSGQRVRGEGRSGKKKKKNNTQDTIHWFETRTGTNLANWSRPLLDSPLSFHENINTYSCNSLYSYPLQSKLKISVKIIYSSLFGIFTLTCLR